MYFSLEGSDHWVRNVYLSSFDSKVLKSVELYCRDGYASTIVWYAENRSVKKSLTAAVVSELRLVIDKLEDRDSFETLELSL